MNLSIWVDDNKKVKFHSTYELPRKASFTGFVERAFGFTVGAAASLGDQMDHPDFPKDAIEMAEQADEYLANLLEETLADTKSIDATLDEFPDHIDTSDVSWGNFFPTMIVQMKLYSEQAVEIVIVSNEREISPGNHERFIAFMTREESKAYNLERDPSMN